MKFLEPDITIKDVAMEIGTNHNYLSKYLNSVIGMTFSVWLHTLRIEESKKLLTGAEKLSIEEIEREWEFLKYITFQDGSRPLQELHHTSIEKQIQNNSNNIILQTDYLYR